jgi:hypothetical protein
VIPLTEFVGALESAHYTGAYEVEIMSDDGRYEVQLDDSLWLEPGDAVAARALARLTDLFAAAGVD